MPKAFNRVLTARKKTSVFATCGNKQQKTVSERNHFIKIKLHSSSAIRYRPTTARGTTFTRG